MYIKSFAKVNVALNILGLREDGFHDLDMVMLPLELCDSIEIEVVPNAHDTFITCDEVSVTGGKYNLAQIAVNKAREKFKFKENFDINIHKEIPISAGLGGGSSNAAAVLMAIIHLLKLNPTRDELIELAKSVGSDVPFFLFNKPSRVGGVGDIVEAIPIKVKYEVLIVKPEAGLSTKAVYEKSNEKPYQNCDINAVIQALSTGDDNLLASSIGNSLETAATELLPEIKDIEKSLKDGGFKIVLMTGSGSSVFAFSRDHHAITKAAKKYEKMGYEVVETKLL